MLARPRDDDIQGSGGSRVPKTSEGNVGDRWQSCLYVAGCLQLDETDATVAIARLLWYPQSRHCFLHAFLLGRFVQNVG